MDDWEKENRIQAEQEELKKMCADVAPNKRDLARRICEKAAFLKVSLEECEEDIRQNGTYEKFQQTKGVPPYDRTRPVVNTFLHFTASYQKYLKQLCDLAASAGKGEPADGFDDFVERDGE